MKNKNLLILSALFSGAVIFAADPKQPKKYLRKMGINGVAQKQNSMFAGVAEGPQKAISPIGGEQPLKAMFGPAQKCKNGGPATVHTPQQEIVRIAGPAQRAVKKP